MKQPDAKSTAPVLKLMLHLYIQNQTYVFLLNFNGESANAYSEALGMDCVSLVLVAAASAAST